MVLSEQPADVIGADRVGTARLVGQGKSALTVSVVSPVTNKMKDMPGTLVQSILQSVVGLPDDPEQLHQLFALQTRQRGVQPLLLLVDLQRMLVTWASHHAQDPQRQSDLQGCRGASTSG